MFRLSGQPVLHRAVDVDLVEIAGDACVQPLAQPRSRSAFRHLRLADLAALPKPTIPGTFSVPDRMPRSWPPPSICSASRTRGLRRGGRRARRRPSARTSCAPSSTRGRSFIVDVERHLAGRLDRVGVEQDALLLGDRADLGDRLQDADLVVGGHDADQDRSCR